MTKLRPYVGVAGFMSSAEIMAAIETLPQDPTHNLAIGILASAKTIVGGTNKYPNRYPRIHDIAEMIRPAQEMVKGQDLPVEFILHFAVDERESFYIQLERARDALDDCEFDGIQINAPPSTITRRELLTALGITRRNSKTAKRVIAQIRPSRGAEPFVDLIEAGVDVCSILNQAHEAFITDVLIDASAGRGIELNGQTASTMIQGIRAGVRAERMTSPHRIGFGVAGGLGPGKLGVVHELMRTHGHLSFDVESGVRDDQDRMDVTVMQTFLHEAWLLVDPASHG